MPKSFCCGIVLEGCTPKLFCCGMVWDIIYA
jgi:hypothetical protein